MVDRPEFPVPDRDPIGEEFDRQSGGPERKSADECPHVRFDPQFLEKLTPQTGFRGFSRFELSPGKFPESSEAVRGFSAGDQDASLFFDDGGGDFLHKHFPS